MRALFEEPGSQATHYYIDILIYYHSKDRFHICLF